MSSANNPQPAQHASYPNPSTHTIDIYYFAKLGRILHEIGAPHLLSTFADVGVNDSKLEELSRMSPENFSRLYSMTEEVSNSFIQQCRTLSFTPPSETSPVYDFSHERALWIKGCLVLEACTKGIRPFVGSVMERLLKKTIENVKKDITRDLGACDDEEWDCSFSGDAAGAKFVEEGPVRLKICEIDTNGIARCSEPHYLKPNVYVPCRMKNIPAGCFSDSDAISPSVPLLICPNPVDIEKQIKTLDASETSETSKSKPHIPTVILLRQINLDQTKEFLNPFRVSRCVPSEPVLEFFAVLCRSQRSHTAKKLGGDDVPLPLEKQEFGFWALTLSGTSYAELNLKNASGIGLKVGHTVRFSGSDLPPGIISGSQYIVKLASNYYFDVCGPIVCPAAPLAAEAFTPDDPPLLVIKRSPVGRYKTNSSA
jgi:hypothetical protein